METGAANGTSETLDRDVAAQALRCQPLRVSESSTTKSPNFCQERNAEHSPPLLLEHCKGQPGVETSCRHTQLDAGLRIALFTSALQDGITTSNTRSETKWMGGTGFGDCHLLLQCSFNSDSPHRCAIQ